MSTQVFLEKLRQRDVWLEADGELLRVDAPAGAVTEELRGALVSSDSMALAPLASAELMCPLPSLSSQSSKTLEVLGRKKRSVIQSKSTWTRLRLWPSS